jgi:hypothetical protein
MESIKISERILRGLKAESAGDKVIEEFLISLIYEEFSHSGQWQWNDSYKSLLEKCSNKWEGQNAD